MRLMAFAMLGCLALSACGGGGGDSGGGGGGGSTSQPTIVATIVSFPTGATPPGFLPNGFNTDAGVKVTAQDGSAITTAVVTVNGATLSYSSTVAEFIGAINLAPGAAVAVSVNIGGAVYNASGKQFSTYPTILTPASGSTWSIRSDNLVSWSGAVPDSNSRYALGMFDTSGNLTYPTNGSFLALPASDSSATIPANSMTAGDRFLLVGIVDATVLAGAAQGSGVVIGGFHYAAVKLQDASQTLTGIAVAPRIVTVAPGRSVQLTAQGTYADGSTQDVTAQATWTSSDPTKVTVTTSGAITGVVGGDATVSAALGGFSASASVHIFVPNPSPTPPLSQSVAYQIDYAHAGRATMGSSGPTLPPTATWSTTLNGLISYPIIAGGLVFVTTSINSSGAMYGTSLYALDETTGSIKWGPVSLPGNYAWSGLTYDHGTLFALTGDGVLHAFDPATGTPGWSVAFPGSSATAPPTAVNGVVYAESNGLVAVDESNGGILWSANGAGGDISSPTVSADGVFVSHPCQVFKLDPLVGTTLWHYDGGCVGGGGKTSVYANNQLFVRDPPNDQIFDAATGNQLGTFQSGPVPAFSSSTGFFLANGTLSAIDQSTHNVLWTFAGDGSLISAPIVIDSAVIIGSSTGTVYALNGSSGSVLWSASAGAGINGPDEQNLSQPLTGFGAGEGYLVVPAGNVLTAWRLVP